MVDTPRQACAQGRAHQINISRGGVPKLPVDTAQVTPEGVTGDYHNDVHNHGGPLQAVCLYSLEQIDRLASQGHPIYPGATGENVTVSGIPLELLIPGAQVRIGTEVVLEITGYTTPCNTIADAFSDGDFTRISQKLHPHQGRVYARVIHGGAIRQGDKVVVSAAREPERTE